ncbi:non-canonical purine NTP pyrophosphatase [Pseudomonas lopnurensis]|uniref:non-canonical purine NTP pyrophosphatase n=1 Tax=Pseudomonas lopnurensis TaxID=1477517 RepID=UPI00187AD337|nr:non-canonical purine NTP pyrophosphatase [Pseudomonas lopnurensis]MBE7373727.1 non-canonical purine NTP pyrophosphatase [Pseudomonas lopnurensis]
MKIRFASINQQKIREVREILEPSGIEVLPFPVRIEELRTEDLQQLVSDKLLAAFKLIGKPVFVEHTGLFIRSLNGFPGGLTQIFWERLQAERFSELISRLDDPAAEAKTLIGYCDGRKRHFFEGVVAGRISPKPAGRGGFEWDDVFIPDGQSRTFAELGGRKNGLSMRRHALDAFVGFLKGH